MKINKRLIRIALISLAAAITLTYITYMGLKKATEPEPVRRIAYFRYNIERDTILQESDIAFVDTPVSLIPRTAIYSADQIVGKRLIIKAEQGDMVLPGKLIERGDVIADVKQLWTIGIDVTNISSFLGGNIKEGKEYILLYKDASGEVTVVSKVKVANLMDAGGKIITGSGEAVIKTLNVSVDSEETLLKIAGLKEIGKFEIVDAPEEPVKP